MIGLVWWLAVITFAAATLVAIFDAINAEFQRWTVPSIVYLMVVLWAEAALLCWPAIGWWCIAGGLMIGLLGLVLIVHINTWIFKYIRGG